MRKGFTLVELSIALVIVGLLIGGILVGQSLMSAAQLNSVVSRFQQYDIAINNFKHKYKELPGDSTKFQLSDCNPGPYGNGNGLINISGGGGWHDQAEVANVFRQLSMLKFIDDGKTYTACNQSTTGTPWFKFDGKRFTSYIYGITSLNKNFHVISSSTSLAG